MGTRGRCVSQVPRRRQLSGHACQLRIWLPPPSAPARTLRVAWAVLSNRPTRPLLRVQLAEKFATCFEHGPVGPVGPVRSPPPPRVRLLPRNNSWLLPASMATPPPAASLPPASSAESRALLRAEPGALLEEAISRLHGISPSGAAVVHSVVESVLALEALESPPPELAELLARCVDERHEQLAMPLASLRALAASCTSSVTSPTYQPRPAGYDVRHARQAPSSLSPRPSSLPLTSPAFPVSAGPRRQYRGLLLVSGEEPGGTPV